jgi:hypothetical protein
MKIDIGDNVKIPYNKGATRWLGFWLDSALNFKDHYTKRMAKAREMEKSIQRLHGQYGMTQGNVRKVTTAVIQASALFGAEIWWRGQKSRSEEIQVMFNRQARAIMGCMKTTPIAALLAEARMTPATVFLDNKQRRYAERLVGLPKDHQARSIIPETILKAPPRGGEEDEDYRPNTRSQNRA